MNSNHAQIFGPQMSLLYSVVYQLVFSHAFYCDIYWTGTYFLTNLCTTIEIKLLRTSFM